MKISLIEWLKTNAHLVHSLSKGVASSRRRSKNTYSKEVVIRIQKGKETSYKITRYTETQDFTAVLTHVELLEWLKDVSFQFKQLELFFEDGRIVHMRLPQESPAKEAFIKEHKSAPFQKAIESHNRIKEHPIPEKTPFAPFVHLGVMDPNGNVKPSMRHKFIQVNSFISLMRDSIASYMSKHQSPLHIIDFGCGKGYLTVAMAWYFAQIYPNRIRVTGVDSRPEVVAACQKAGKDIPNLLFAVSSIGEADPDLLLSSPEEKIAVVALHACNTATDVALYKATQLQASLFFVAPCCHSELNKVLLKSYLPFVTAYPTLKQRLSSLLTDAYRAAIMKSIGWSIDVVEFVDPEHTPKNTLIRGVFTGKKTELPQEVAALQQHMSDALLLEKLFLSAQE